jgi:hypothetical protein
MYSDVLDSAQYHQDDLIQIGMALEAVRLVTVDYKAVEARNTAYIRENIAARQRRENSLDQIQATW